MATQSVQAIILAAGRSSRFNTETTKLTFALCGQPMITYVAKLFTSLQLPITFVIGHQQDALRQVLQAVEPNFAEQKEQKGTGHALLCSSSYWHADFLLVMNGDMPLVSEDIIRRLLKKQSETDAAITFVTAHAIDAQASAYGRVVQEDNKIAIIEARNFQGEATTDYCINAGIYLFKRSFIEAYSAELKPNSVTGELYITDFIELASRNNYKVATVSAPFDYIRGINTLKELWVAEHIKRSQLITHWLEKGVRFKMPQTVHLDTDIHIGAGTTIEAGVQIRSGTQIGKNCTIDAFSIVENSIIHDQVTIKAHSVISDAVIEDYAQVGPFAHLHKQVFLGKQAVIGNFVEASRATISTSSKIKHLSYIGQATIGNQVNIGAGTITCNYNGVAKHSTTIKDGAQIGSNNCLVAPVIIGKNSMTGAGSVITEDIPDNALAIARARQVTKPDYAPKLKKQYHEQNNT